MDSKTYENVLTEMENAVDLPAAIGSWKRRELSAEERERHVLFCYEEAAFGWRILGLYADETADFMVKYDLGLIVLTDIRFTYDNVANFWKILQADFVRVITDRFVRRDETASILVKNAGILDWESEHGIPEACRHYRRVIVPSAPILGLNGSYIILAYADATNTKGILFFYNVFRDDFFAETRNQGVPGILHDFDAATVKELSQKIEAHLAGTLSALDG